MSSRRQRSIPIGGRYRQVSLYCKALMVYLLDKLFSERIRPPVEWEALTTMSSPRIVLICLVSKKAVTRFKIVIPNHNGRQPGNDTFECFSKNIGNLGLFMFLLHLFWRAQFAISMGHAITYSGTYQCIYGLILSKYEIPSHFYQEYIFSRILFSGYQLWKWTTTYRAIDVDVRWASQRADYSIV